MRKPVIGGNTLTLSEAHKLIQLARRVQSGGYAFLFLDEKTKSIYEGIDDKQSGGAYEIKRLEDSYFRNTAIEAFADMLWFELGWSVNVNSLKNNDALMRLFR